MTVSLWQAIKAAPDTGGSHLTRATRYADSAGLTLTATVAEDWESDDRLAAFYHSRGFTIVKPDNVLAREPQIGG